MQGRLCIQRIALLQNVFHRHPFRTLFRKVPLNQACFPTQNIHFSKLYTSKSVHPESTPLPNVPHLHKFLKFILDDTVQMPMSKYAEICALADVQDLGSILHYLGNNRLHNQLDMLHKAMEDHGHHVGQGVNTTLIRSYLARKMWKEAMGILSDMEKNQIMKHTRSYNPLITGLAEQGYALEAFHLFQKKMQMYHVIGNKRESIIRDTKMFVSLINSCCIGNQKSLLGTLTENDTEINEIHSLVLRLFDFFHEFGIQIPLDVLQACKRWFSCDPNNSWIWRNCDVNQDGKCQLCGVQLENDLPEGYFSSLDKEIIHKLSGSSDDLMCSQEEIDELKAVHDFCMTNGPFDVIIDGQNLGLEGKKKNKNSTKLFGKRLFQVVSYISKQRKKIFLPLHQKALENDIPEKLLHALRKHCEIWLINSDINDDLLLLYAVAINGMNTSKTCIVSNDNWRDHSLMLSNDNRVKLLKWARLNHVMFDVVDKSQVRFYRNLFDPVVQRSENAWHLPVIDGSWRCAVLK